MKWIRIVTELWAGQQVAIGDRDGQPALVRPLPPSPPLLYVGGESEPGRVLAAETADVFFINGRPFADTVAVIEDLRARPRDGAPLRFGLSAFVIARETEAEAAAELSYLQSLSDAESRPEISGGTDPDTQMYKVLSGTKRIGSNGGTLAGLVGSYEQVIERIEAFHDAGVELFMLQFQPIEAEVDRFADRIIPHFR
jgi:alkanesulfonate monooxygenase